MHERLRAEPNRFRTYPVSYPERCEITGYVGNRGYASFGRVVESTDVVDAIDHGSSVADAGLAGEKPMCGRG